MNQRSKKLISKPLSPRLMSALVASMVTMVTIGAGHPRLVVGIMIDGLRQETLDMLRENLGANGFNRFIRDGVVLENVDFGTNLDPVASTAMLMTGSSPSVNGIDGAYRYDPAGRRMVHIFTDDNAMGNYTTLGLSPNALRVSTLSDEARIAGAGVTYCYSIAPDAAQALIMAGHSGNSAVWFNEESGNWASSMYYGDMPTPPLNANRTNSLVNRIDTMQWTPSSETAKAGVLPDHLIRYPFRHVLGRAGAERFVRFANTPLINNEVTSLAESYINVLQLGRHEGVDVLNLGFTLQPYESTKTAENRYEQLDSYVKLDKSLARLFSTIDRTVGRENAVIYIAGTPSRGYRRRDDEKWHIPTGDFSSRKAMSLLNLHLLSLHGDGQWAVAYHDGHFYLDEQLAAKHNIAITDLRREAAEFLTRMSGVDKAYSIDDVAAANINTPNARAIRDNTVLENSGDVIIELEPGWRLNDDFNGVMPHDGNNVNVLAPTTAPFMIVAPGLKPYRIDTPVDARVIAPTVAGMLHIRSPNGASMPRLNLAK